MDIAKYIGQFLLKNNFCYIHGLGNLELRKKPASYDGQSVSSPQFEVLLTPTGSIDDNLANFIAVNEQISISKAANSLREFSMESRAALQEGKEVIIPGIGKYIQQQNGKLQFITDPHLQYTPPSIPALKIVKREEEPKPKITAESQNERSNAANINWGKIILWVVILGVVIAAVVMGISYINSHNVPADVKPATVDTPVQQAPVNNAPVPDTMATKPADTAAPAVPPAPTPAANGTMQYKVILNTYPARALAEKRAKKLTGYGNAVEVAAKDSTTFYVVMPVNGSIADTARVLDSLRKNFNPKGVSVLH
ncbi:hypothetical protein ACTHGU_22060 [Chitinophagaceae bacterium MMS25-I14]